MKLFKSLPFYKRSNYSTACNNLSLTTHLQKRSFKYLTTLKYKEVRLGWINGNLQAEHFWIKNAFCPIKEGRVVLANRLLNKFFTD